MNILDNVRLPKAAFYIFLLFWEHVQRCPREACIFEAPFHSFLEHIVLRAIGYVCEASIVGKIFDCQPGGPLLNSWPGPGDLLLPCPWTRTLIKPLVGRSQGLSGDLRDCSFLMGRGVSGI